MRPGSDDVEITYPVKRSHIGRALQLLGQARRTTRRFYRFLMGTAIAFGIAALAQVALAYVLPLMVSAESAQIAIGILLVLASVIGALLVIAFLAGLPLMGIHWWLSRRLGKTGLGDIDLLRATLRARAFQVLGALGASLGMIFVWLGFGIESISMVDPAFIEGDEHGSLAIRILLVVGLLLTLPHFISRQRHSRDLIRRIDTLEKTLSEYDRSAPGDETIDIPVEDLNLLAKIEGAQIERERTEAIAEARREARADDYALLNSRAAMDAMSRLEPASRVRLQQRAAALIHDPEPDDATWDESALAWRLTMPDSDLELNYVVDREQHQVKILTVEGLQGEPGARAPNQ